MKFTVRLVVWVKMDSGKNEINLRKHFHMKSMSILFSFLVVAALVISCGDQESKKNPEQNAALATNSDTVKITAAMVDNKRDPSCGMPVSAGIGDTAHYKGKVLGFCSKECKDEFLKDPEKNITAADLKK